MKTKLIILVGAIALSGCGARVALTPEAGGAMPQKPAMAAKVPTADQLITSDTQARPERSDEQLRRSEKRQDDKFDLPPTD
jgi:hypothetical protein